jgi:hypothetical protein
MRHHAPGRACSHNPTQAVEDLTQGVRALRSVLGHQGEVRGDEHPFLVRLRHWDSFGVAYAKTYHSQKFITGSREAHVGCQIYFIRAGQLVARAKADEFSHLPAGEHRESYTGVSEEKGGWHVLWMYYPSISDCCTSRHSFRDSAM